MIMRKLPPLKPLTHFNPTALRKAKIVYNFGLSECNRVVYNFGLSKCNRVVYNFGLSESNRVTLTLLHSERPKLYTTLAKIVYIWSSLSAIRLRWLRCDHTHSTNGW